jgi:hypothetical protein
VLDALGIDIVTTYLTHSLRLQTVLKLFHILFSFDHQRTRHNTMTNSFFVLPPELRLIIYGHLVTAGLCAKGTSSLGSYAQVARCTSGGRSSPCQISERLRIHRTTFRNHNHFANLAVLESGITDFLTPVRAYHPNFIPYMYSVMVDSRVPS